MLTGPEQRRLKQIEQELAAEDPRLARSLEHGSARARLHGRWPYTVAAVVSVVLLVVFAVAGLPAPALLCAAAVTIALLLRHRHTRAARRDRPR